jgi:hypothetical protein
VRGKARADVGFARRLTDRSDARPGLQQVMGLRPTKLVMIAQETG